MKKNIASVIDAFHAEEAYQDKTCRTDGKAIYSYALLIAARYGSAVYVLDGSKSPSRTTSGHIRAVWEALPSAKTATSEAMLRRLLEGDDSDLEPPESGSYEYREDFHADG